MREGNISTDLIHGHEYYDERLGLFKVPIYLSAVYEQFDRESGEPRLSSRGVELKYSREENPTTLALERALARLEGGIDAIAFSSGMAAISALYLSKLERGSRIVVPKEAYGTTIQLARDLEKFGVEVSSAWPSAESIVEALDGGADIVLVEVVTNPTLKVVDVCEVAKACAECGATLVVDNTLASPVLFKPLLRGAPLVVESATKYIAGHNDVVAGVVASRSLELAREMWEWRRRLGSILPPFEAYLVLRGLATLEVRFERYSKSALEIAEFLEDHPRVSEVLYPGLESSPYRQLADRLFERKLYGGVLSFRVSGGRSRALRVLRRARLVRSSPSFGGPESLLSYPVASASKFVPEEDRERLGITEDLLRLSVGLEDPADIMEDLDRALGD